MLRALPLSSLLLSLCITFSFTYPVVAQCDSGEAVTDSDSCESCTSGNPAERVYCQQEGRVRAVIACLADGWKSAQKPWESFPVSAQGGCERAGTGGQPVCLPAYEGPWYYGTIGISVSFKHAARDAYADPQDGIGCLFEPMETITLDIPGEGCCGATCNDSYGCESTGRWFNASNCSCQVGTDNDRDGYFAEDYDCNDSDPYVNPSQVVDCNNTTPGADRNCNGIEDRIEGNCAPYTPILIGGGSEPSTLTDISRGVDFDFDGNGVRDRVSWTQPGSGAGWLTLDRNGNGQIDDGSELFGNFTPQPHSPSPNGFLALAVFDAPSAQGNANGWLDAGDLIYSRLRVWVDANHDGLSQSTELTDLTSYGVRAISLDYRETAKRDRWGNLFRYAAEIEGLRVPWAYDVLLLRRSLRTEP